MYGVLLVCCIFLNLINFSYELNEPKVTIGKISYIGYYLETWNSENIAAFRGIRFAQPPIGDLRFKDPKPIQYNFSIEYDATKFGNECPSTYAVNPSEDCLFLNVFAKKIYENSFSSPLKPVIIFIHPGGLYIESSSRYGPEYLLTKDIILVTLNYRLGTLGFLNIGTKDIPGNAGLKDQVIAFRWVQQNIAAFGGNPQDITIMGYSAGALSVCLHLVSPMSQGLFQRAIIMSGTLPPQMKIKSEQKYLAIRQAKVMGCDINFDDTNQILECLNKFSGNEIALTLRSMFDFGNDNPIYLWEPVLEKDYGQERFLIEDPYKSFKNGDFAKVPILIGFTNNEFCNSAGDILHNKSLLNDFNENFQKLAPICFNYNDFDKEKMNLITEKLKNYYFSNEKVTMEKFSNLCELFSDSIIRFGAHRLAEIISQYNVPVYTYKFSYAGRFTTLNFPGGPKGAEHMDDMMYLFPTETVKFNVTDPEAQIVNTMVQLITFFAQNSKPLEIDNEEQKLDFVSNTYIEIQDKLEIKQGRNIDNINIWNELFPL